MVSFLKSFRKKVKSNLAKLTRNRPKIPPSRSRSRTRSRSEQNPMQTQSSISSEYNKSVTPYSKELKDRCKKPINPSLKTFICKRDGLSEYVSRMKTINAGLLKDCTEEEHTARYNNLCANIGFEDYLDNYRNVYPGISEDDFKVYWSNLPQKIKDSHTRIAEWILVMKRNKARNSKKSKTSREVRSALV